MAESNDKMLAYLQSDPLRHLVHLKYLNLYPNDVQVEFVEAADSTGVMLSYPTALTSWDVAAYAHAQWVLLPTASEQWAAQRLVEKAVAIAQLGCPLVCKFCDTITRDVFAQTFRLQHVKTLISYTTCSAPARLSTGDVIVSSALDEANLPLYIANGYTEAEVRRYFGAGALAFTVYEQDVPVSTCMSFHNFGSIWEIGAVHTIAGARRRGLGRQVVAMALKTLLARGKIPRYQVQEENAASNRLAQSLGMVPCLRFEHYLAETE